MKLPTHYAVLPSACTYRVKRGGVLLSDRCPLKVFHSSGELIQLQGVSLDVPW